MCRYFFSSRLLLTNSSNISYASNYLPNGLTTLNPCRFDVVITSIRRRPNFGEFPRHFRVLFRCNFGGRKIHVVSTYFFDVISIVEKSTWFPRTLFDVTSLVEKSMWFPRTFLDVISMVEKSTWFPRTFFDVISMVEICTLFLLTFFDVILMGKDLTWFLVSCKLMKTFQKFFPVFVTLNS